MKKIFLIIITFTISVIYYNDLFSLTTSETNPTKYSELWGYLMKGEEVFLRSEMPVTDIGYFSAGINSFGNFQNNLTKNDIKNFRGKVHLVVAELGNHSLTHFLLNPKYELRDQLISDIYLASENFDGVQIDFEKVLSKDGDNFLEFLTLLKKQLKGKCLSVAVPARKRFIKDAYDYERLGVIADRIIIMAYDEHWSTSEPGPIASYDWCRDVMNYALIKIDKEKIVMGIPFYGRSWVNKKYNRAYKFIDTEKILNNINPEINYTVDGMPFFIYDSSVTVTYYFENAKTIRSKLQLYQGSSINKVAFWRISQEDPDVWNIFN